MGLNLSPNTVIVWNTVYMQAMLAPLQAEGNAVEEDDVAHLSTARFEHVHPYGK
jgi:TnpA family transposase